jgi:hypothetical protein
MQTLELGAEPHERKRPPEIGLPWSLLFIPVLLVLGAISIPYAFVGSYIQRRHERSFSIEMKQRGRAIDWPHFQQMINQARGTLIVERYSVKGPVRWWWTSDDIYAICPHPIVDWITKMHNDESNRPLAEWCHQRYTGLEEGRALLVDAVPNNVHTGKCAWIRVG